MGDACKVIEFLPQVRTRECLLREFLKKMRAERRFMYLESGITRERVQKTVNALFLFLASKDCVGEKTGFQLETVAFVLECEWNHKPTPAAKDIAEKAFELLVSKTETGAIQRRHTDDIGLDGNVVRLYTKTRPAAT